MDEHGNLYFGENPKEEDVKRLKEALEDPEKLEDITKRLNQLRERIGEQ